MIISRKRYEELETAHSRLVNENFCLTLENKTLQDELAVLKGDKRRADALCEGCKHLVTTNERWEVVYRCKLNRTCKDFKSAEESKCE